MAMRRLPTVTIATFMKDPLGWTAGHQAEAAALRAAFSQTGFAVLEGHNVPRNVMADSLKVTDRFFATAPASEKEALKMRGFRGYQEVWSNVTKGSRDCHEALDFYREPCAGVEGVLGRHDNLWPSTPPDFKETIERYVGHLLGAGPAVLSCVARGLELPPDYFDKLLTSPFWGMRAINYPPGPGVQGCGEHTDYGFLTFLHTDGTPRALEVQLLSGEWFPVSGVPDDAFIINIGDMLSHLTGGVYRATPHRVAGVATRRVSIPFFFEPSYDAVITPIPGLSDTSAFTQPIKYGDHLMSKIRKNFHEYKEGQEEGCL